MQMDIPRFDGTPENISNLITHSVRPHAMAQALTTLAKKGPAASPQTSDDETHPVDVTVDCGRRPKRSSR